MSASEQDVPPAAGRADNALRPGRRGGRRAPGKRRAQASPERRRGRRSWIAGTAVALVAAVATLLLMYAVSGQARPTAPRAESGCPQGECAAGAQAGPSASSLVEESPSLRSISATPSLTPSATVSATPTPSPSSSSSPSSSRSSTPPDPPRSRPGGVQVHYATTNEWQGGFIGSLTITNRSGSALSGWRLVFSYPGDIENVWPNDWERRGRSAVVTGRGLGAGESTKVSFQVEGRDGPPSTCDFNGQGC